MESLMIALLKIQHHTARLEEANKNKVQAAEESVVLELLQKLKPLMTEIKDDIAKMESSWSNNVLSPNAQNNKQNSEKGFTTPPPPTTINEELQKLDTR
jgi:hypothetical protein